MSTKNSTHVNTMKQILFQVDSYIGMRTYFFLHMLGHNLQKEHLYSIKPRAAQSDGKS